MSAAEIFARLEPQERDELARYYRYTLGREGAAHNPKHVALALLKLTPEERSQLSVEVRKRFAA